MELISKNKLKLNSPRSVKETLHTEAIVRVVSTKEIFVKENDKKSFRINYQLGVILGKDKKFTPLRTSFLLIPNITLNTQLKDLDTPKQYEDYSDQRAYAVYYILRKFIAKDLGLKSEDSIIISS